MKIIIPMAGHSRRFKQAGYKTPKQFINIDGKPMIERVCRMFSPNDEFVFICNREHLEDRENRRVLESATQFYNIVEIEPHELGPVYSALQAKPFVSDDEPIILSYCDFTMQWDYRRFLMKVAQYDGAVAVFKGMHPASLGNTYYAYVKADENMEMVELREKQSFTPNRMDEFASTGVYYIDTWNSFANYAEEILNTKKSVGSEYYASLIYNPMVGDGRKICLFEVEKFICWGTPEDLEEYIHWSEYFGRDQRHLLELDNA